MNWDALQRAVLDELGLVSFHRRGSGPAPSNLPAQPLGGDEPLLKHLLRAAGRDATRAAEVLAIVQSLEGVRGNPGAKRALWPLLRALRRR